MTIFKLLAVLLVSWTAAARAATVTLAWDASPSTNVVTYRVYYGTASRVYAGWQSTTNLTLTVTNLAASARYFFAVTALNGLQTESEFSNEVSSTTPVAPPVNTRVLTNSLQGAVSPSGPWTNLQVYTVQVPASEILFVRGVLEWAQGTGENFRR